MAVKVISDAPSVEWLDPYDIVLYRVIPMFIEKCVAAGYPVRKGYTLKNPIDGITTYNEPYQGGTEIVITSLYRSPALQRKYWEDWNAYKNNKSLPHAFPANEPGKSFHEWGAAFDFCPVINKVIHRDRTPLTNPTWNVVGKIAEQCGMVWFGAQKTKAFGQGGIRMGTYSSSYSSGESGSSSSGEIEYGSDTVHCQLAGIELATLQSGQKIAFNSGTTTTRSRVQLASIPAEGQPTKGCTPA